MSDLALAIRQVKYENLAFWRNPAAAFFTVVFPLMFLVIFSFAFGDEPVRVPGGETTQTTFIIPAIVTFSIINSQYTAVASVIVFARDQGLLKRFRGTPLTAWAYMFGRIAHSTLIGLLLVAITVAAGALFYGVEVPTTTMPAFIATLLIAIATFSALGTAITTVIPNAEAGTAIINFSILPLLFLSDVFIVFQDPPAWLEVVRNLFPVIHVVKALFTAFNPFTIGAGFEPGHLAVIAAWGIVGSAVSIRFFSWEPSR